jgi:KDO2-lipid IV(A) lauroyltransferase
MNLADIAGNPGLMRLGMSLARYLPPVVGHGLATIAARTVGSLRPGVYHIVRANLSQVLGPGANPQLLGQKVCEVFNTTLRGYYDLYRLVQLPREAMAQAVHIPETSRAVMRCMWKAARGTVLILPHLGNFDLGGQATAGSLPELQLMTLPNPNPGHQVDNEIRRRTGINVTPLDSAALRQAIRLLRRGGVVGIAGDRPVSELDELVSFFGRPARVPSGHVRLALKTGADLAFGYCVWTPETRGYTMWFEGPMDLVRATDREEEIRINVQRVVDRLEAIIRPWLGQWQMYVPVWPELLEA